MLERGGWEEGASRRVSMGSDEGLEPEGSWEEEAAMARLKMRCCSVALVFRFTFQTSPEFRRS